MKKQEFALLDSCGAIITYAPLRTEVSFRDFLILPTGAIIYEIPPRASLDPFMEAHKAAIAVHGQKTAVLMPGRQFDASGTRFGQGGGWYDRFLSETPKEWVRIGFCHDHQFSQVPLPRREWDQVMDYVCVVSGSDLAVYETHERA